MLLFLFGMMAGVIICLTPIKNLLEKVERYEDLTTEMLARLSAVLNHIRQVDERGSFEADDEVGDTFKAIQQSVETLEDFLNVESEDASTR